MLNTFTVYVATIGRAFQVDGVVVEDRSAICSGSICSTQPQ
jgi:hypothetical protein